MPSTGASPEDRTAELESQILALRARLSDAVRKKDLAGQADLRAELRRAQRAYADALEAELEEAEPVEEPRPPKIESKQRHSVSLPVREQVYQALTILGAPGSPKLISEVHEAFFNEEVVTTRLASLRRDEQKSFETQPYARPYYICSALTHDRLTAARGVLAISVWPLERRIIGPLGPRVNFLTHAIALAEQMLRMSDAGREPSPQAGRLLRRFTANIPGAGDPFENLDGDLVIRAARSELSVHTESDLEQRREAAARAARIPEVSRLFGHEGLAVVQRAAQ